MNALRISLLISVAYLFLADAEENQTRKEFHKQWRNLSGKRAAVNDEKFIALLDTLNQCAMGSEDDGSARRKRDAEEESEQIQRFKKWWENAGGKIKAIYSTCNIESAETSDLLRRKRSVAVTNLHGRSPVISILRNIEDDLADIDVEDDSTTEVEADAAAMIEQTEEEDQCVDRLEAFASRALQRSSQRGGKGKKRRPRKLLKRLRRKIFKFLRPHMPRVGCAYAKLIEPERKFGNAYKKIIKTIVHNNPPEKFSELEECARSEFIKLAHGIVEGTPEPTVPATVNPLDSFIFFKRRRRSAEEGEETALNAFYRRRTCLVKRGACMKEHEAELDEFRTYWINKQTEVLLNEVDDLVRFFVKKFPCDCEDADTAEFETIIREYVESTARNYLKRHGDAEEDLEDAVADDGDDSASDENSATPQNIRVEQKDAKKEAKLDGRTERKEAQAEKKTQRQGRKQENRAERQERKEVKRGERKERKQLRKEERQQRREVKKAERQERREERNEERPQRRGSKSEERPQRRGSKSEEHPQSRGSRRESGEEAPAGTASPQ